MADLVCDGNGNIAVNDMRDAINLSVKDEDIGVTVQEPLISGTNIKTVNGEDLLGSGNVDIAAAGVNIIINSEVTRINQRAFDGVSFVNGEYCWDRWKATASAMTQIIEDENYDKDTVYTISGENVTTAQITSPSSGHWTLPEISRTARNVKLEIGSVATDYVKENIQADQLKCLRYYYRINSTAAGSDDNTIAFGLIWNSAGASVGMHFVTTMYEAPSVSYRSINDFEIYDTGHHTINSIDTSYLHIDGGELVVNCTGVIVGAAAAFAFSGNAGSYIAFDAEL